MYYFTFIYLFALVFFANKIDEKKKIFYAFIPLFIIVVIRYGVGADYFSYERIYHNLDVNDFYGSLGSMDKIEVLYKLLNLAALKIGLSYHVFVTIIAGFLTWLTLKWIENNSPNFLLSVLLHFSMLFFYWNLSALRQGIVVTILLYIYFNGKKEYSLKIRLLATAILFFMHPTAIIVPIIYLIAKLPWKKKSLLILLLLAPLSRILFRPEFLQLFSGLPYVGKFTSYLSYNSIQYLSLPSLMRFAFLAFILWHYDQLKEKYPNKAIMFNFALISLIMYFYLPVSMVIGTRVTIFGYYLTLIIFPMILSLYSSKKVYSVVLSGLLMWSVVSFYNEYSKLANRTGYKYSMHQLNIETVFEKNRNHFNNAYAFHLQIEEANQQWLKETPLTKKVNTEYDKVDEKYSEGLQYISVYFPVEDKYGIINNNGKVTHLPIYSQRLTIYNNVREANVGEPGFNSIGYKYIGTYAPIFRDYQEVEDIIIDSVNRTKLIEASELIVEVVDSDFIENISFLNDYNLDTVKRVEKFTYDVNQSYSYLKLSTDYGNYFMLLKDNKVLVEKLYNRISPINEKGIIIARTNYSIDYINSIGSIIWYE